MRLSIVFLWLFVLRLSSPAQVSTATVTGMIADPAGALVPGVTVRITSDDTGVTITAKCQREACPHPQRLQRRV
jgi:hypothetical protein